MSNDDVLKEEAKSEFVGIPRRFREKHFETLRGLYVLTQALLERKRKYPPMREELIRLGYSKADLKELERMGFIQSGLMEMARGDKRLGTRTVMFLSPQGDALIRYVLQSAQEMAPAVDAAPIAEAQPAETIAEAMPAADSTPTAE